MKAKPRRYYATDDPELLIVAYKDDATAFNGLKKGTIAGKGVINNRDEQPAHAPCWRSRASPPISSRSLTTARPLVKKVSIVPLEVIVRNISAGSFAKRYGVEEGIVFEHPTIEFSYKNDDLGDPLLNDLPRPGSEAGYRRGDRDHQELRLRGSTTLLKAFWTSCGVTLVDFKLEFGQTWPTAPSSWPTRSAPTPAASGTPRPMRSWTRTASAGTWAAWRKPTPRLCAVWKST